MLTIKAAPRRRLTAAEAAVYWYLLANCSAPADEVFRSLRMRGGRRVFDEAVSGLRSAGVLVA